MQLCKPTANNMFTVLDIYREAFSLNFTYQTCLFPYLIQSGLLIISVKLSSWQVMFRME